MNLVKSNLKRIGAAALTVLVVGGSVYTLNASAAEKANPVTLDQSKIAGVYTLSDEEAAKLIKEGAIKETVLPKEGTIEEPIKAEEEYSYVIDLEKGKVTEGMRPELVGEGIFGKTGIDGEESTAEYMNIAKDGSVTVRPLTKEESKEFNVEK